MADDTEFLKALEWEMVGLKQDWERATNRHLALNRVYEGPLDLEFLRLKVLLWLCG